MYSEDVFLFHRIAPAMCRTPGIYIAPSNIVLSYVQDWSAQNCAGRVSSISTLHVGPFGGLEVDRGGDATPSACFGGVFPKNIGAAERPALTNKTRILHKVYPAHSFVPTRPAHRASQ